MSAAKVDLGRHLFYDKRLSVNGTESCATCHRQRLAFTDGLAHARGATGKFHPRSSMSLANVGYAPSLTWADPALTRLEDQALIPMLGDTPVELGLKNRGSEILALLHSDSVYRDLFPRAFPGESDPYNLSNTTKALAAFERTIVSLRSPYDRYRWAGDPTALSEAAKRGEILFFSGEHAGCFRCHGGWNFNGDVRYEGGTAKIAGEFFNTGVSTYVEPNRGLFEHTQTREDIGKFRVPSLRNIAVTEPYMHDGSLATLADVVDHYVMGGKYADPNKSKLMHPLHLTAAEKQDLIEFLKSLTDEELLHDPRWSDPWPSLKR
jgi:cytochrome c peroxidase